MSDTMKPGLAESLYESEADLRDVQRLLMEGRARTSDWRYPHVGEFMWNFFMVLSHQKPEECIRLWRHGEKVAGYVALGEDPSIDVQVLPEYEGAGIEEEALAWVDSQLRRQGAGEAGLVSGARASDGRRLAFLEAHGFRLRGTFSEVNLIRPLDGPLPEVGLPPDFTLRAVAPEGEAAARAGAQHEVWQPWSVGNITGADYEKLMRLPGYDRELDLIAISEDRVIASYANCWIDPVNRIGDFGPVGALPGFRRRGLTRAVMLEGMRRMQARGMNRACVSTTETNTAARNLYESLGFRIVDRFLDFVR